MPWLSHLGRVPSGPNPNPLTLHSTVGSRVQVPWLAYLGRASSGSKACRLHGGRLRQRQEKVLRRRPAPLHVQPARPHAVGRWDATLRARRHGARPTQHVYIIDIYVYIYIYIYELYVYIYI